MLTRKNYTWFVNWMAKNGINGLAEIELIEYFEHDNPNFDRKIFNRCLLNAKADVEEYNRDLKERLRNGRV